MVLCSAKRRSPNVQRREFRLTGLTSIASSRRIPSPLEHRLEYEEIQSGSLDDQRNASIAAAVMTARSLSLSLFLSAPDQLDLVIMARNLTEPPLDLVLNISATLTIQQTRHKISTSAIAASRIDPRPCADKAEEPENNKIVFYT